jgi:hypothetical protein
MPKSSSVKKEKKTFSLSRESLRYLDAVRKERKSASVSSVLDELIRQQRQAKELERISSSFTRYYDSLRDEEISQDLAWGKFALTQFPPEE